MLFKCLLKIFPNYVYLLSTVLPRYIYFLPPDPADYRGGTLPLTFSSITSAPQCGTISIENDDICEGDETFTCLLSTSDSQITLSPSAGTVTINDDDGNLLLLLYIK